MRAIKLVRFSIDVSTVETLGVWMCGESGAKIIDIFISLQAEFAQEKKQGDRNGLLAINAFI